MNVEDLKNICGSFPAVTTDIKWGHDLVFSVGEKMFCVVGLDESPVTASFKVSDEEFDELSTRAYFKPAPYMARHKWVFITDITKMKRSEWKTHLKGSYDLVRAKLPAKVQKQLK